MAVNIWELDLANIHIYIYANSIHPERNDFVLKFSLHPVCRQSGKLHVHRIFFSDASFINLHRKKLKQKSQSAAAWRMRLQTFIENDMRWQITDTTRSLLYIYWNKWSPPQSAGILCAFSPEAGINAKHALHTFRIYI